MTSKYSICDKILKNLDSKITKYKKEKFLNEFFSTNKNLDLLSIYKNSKNWIESNSIYNKGIKPWLSIPDNFQNIAYPEVTGYFIPSLLDWGFRDKAISWAKWLVSIQHEDGSWYDYSNDDPYTFDTAQILRGLTSVYPIMPEIKQSIIKGADYILSMQEENGNLTTASKKYWMNGIATELIHLYCLPPLKQIGEIFGEEKYINSANKALKYYTTEHREKLLDFHTLSHFYAYMMEALIDMGETELAKQAMNKVSKLQRKNGMVPAYKNVKWTCSTGLFQFAICWYKLGEKIKADKAFAYACSLQTKNGGWLGSYGKGANYLPKAEISWANKYFLDALKLKISTHFANTTDTKMKNFNGAYALLDEIDCIQR